MLVKHSIFEDCVELGREKRKEFFSPVDENRNGQEWGNSFNWGGVRYGNWPGDMGGARFTLLRLKLGNTRRAQPRGIHSSGADAIS